MDPSGILLNNGIECKNIFPQLRIGNKFLVYMNYFVITHSRNELEKEDWTLTFFIDWDNGTVEKVFETSMTLTGVEKLHNN